MSSSSSNSDEPPPDEEAVVSSSSDCVSLSSESSTSSGDNNSTSSADEHDEDFIPAKKKYKLAEPEVPPDPAYWPPIETAEEGSHAGEPCHSDQRDSDTPSTEDEDITLSSSSDESSVCNSSSSDSEREDSVCSLDIFSENSDNSSVSDHEISDSSDDEDFISGIQTKLFNGSDMSVDQSVLLIMKSLYMKHRLSKKVTGEILTAILKLLPKDNLLPKSRHLLFKHVNDASPMPREQVHFYCQTCHLHLGSEAIQCSLCKCNDSNQFFQIPIAQQIKILFELHNLADILDNYRDERNSQGACSDVYYDICDGQEYQRASCNGNYDLVLMAHTDGVSVSDSSTASFWPLEYVICEVPPKLRFLFVLISGLWVDKAKPHLNTYLKPFAEELRDLYINGVRWTHPKTKVEHVTRVVAPCLCGDAPVRADAVFVQHPGGRYSCISCEQKMVKWDPKNLERNGKKRAKRVFAFQEEASRVRSSVRMKAQAEKSLKKRKSGDKEAACKGVKGRSVLRKFPQCDVSTAVYPEYMHVIYGLIKRVFCPLWFKTNPRDPWSLRNHIGSINNFLESVQVPDNVTRVPKVVDSFGEWKAHECRFFILILSLVAFSDCMAEIYFQHWILFVQAMFLLLQESISENDLERAEIMLNLFLRDFSKLYRAEDFTYNMHCLQHFVTTVRRWGPLPFNSAFQFENFNGLLSKCIHGTNNQAKELLNTIRLYEGVKALEARVQVSSVPTASGNNASFRNKIVKFPFSPDVKAVLTNSNLQEPVSLYSRIVIKGEKFTCSIYKRQKRRNNYTVCYENASGNQDYGEIMCYCVDGADAKFCLVNRFTVETLRTFVHVGGAFVVKHLIPVQKSATVVLISLDSIVSKIIRVGNYVGLRPNSYEVNL